MGRLRAPLDAELLKALRRILERLNKLRMSEPHDEVTSYLQRGIRHKIAEIACSAQLGTRVCIRRCSDHQGSTAHSVCALRNISLVKNYMGVGVAMGVGLGAALGVALHKSPVWIAIGAALGVVFGLVMNRQKRNSSRF